MLWSSRDKHSGDETQEVALFTHKLFILIIGSWLQRILDPWLLYILAIETSPIVLVLKWLKDLS